MIEAALSTALFLALVNMLGRTIGPQTWSLIKDHFRRTPETRPAHRIVRHATLVVLVVLNLSLPTVAAILLVKNFNPAVDRGSHIIVVYPPDRA